MILGIGSDAVEIERFSRFSTYNNRQLERIFSDHEINYCLNEPKKSRERFAARFAAKEALYKALCQTSPDHTLHFLHLCKHASIRTTPAPTFVVDWQKIDLPPHNVLVSLTHSRNLAIAQVIVQESTQKI